VSTNAATLQRGDSGGVATAAAAAVLLALLFIGKLM